MILWNDNSLASNTCYAYAVILIFFFYTYPIFFFFCFVLFIYLFIYLFICYSFFFFWFYWIFLLLWKPWHRFSSFYSQKDFCTFYSLFCSISLLMIFWERNFKYYLSWWFLTGWLLFWLIIIIFTTCSIFDMCK